MRSSGQMVVGSCERTYSCARCGNIFAIEPDLAELFAAWTPQVCERCSGPPRPERPSLTASDVLERLEGGPETGVFAAAFCDPNPGAGAWAVVRVAGNAIVRERSGAEPATTGSRMAMKSLIEALEGLDPRERVTVFSSREDSVNTIKLWAPAWRRNGWRRNRDHVANLDLVRRGLELFEARPNVDLAFLRAHAGSRWLGYADSLARWQLFDFAEGGELAPAV